MNVLINGQSGQNISVDDRGLLYGQTLFETIAVTGGRACLLSAHLTRLKQGCAALGFDYPESLQDEIESFCQSEHYRSLDKGVLRVTLTMGQGGRGYRNPETPEITRILSQHNYPNHPSHYWHDGIVCGVADIRLGHQPALAGLKHGNRLEQTIARAQWQTDWQEALLLDQNDSVIEATQSNLFIVKDNIVYTPRLDLAGVAGVMRETIIELAESFGVRTRIMPLSLPEIERAETVFLSNSLIGVWPVKQLNSTSYFDLSFPHKLMNALIKNEFVPSY